MQLIGYYKDIGNFELCGNSGDYSGTIVVLLVRPHEQDQDIGKRGCQHRLVVQSRMSINQEIVEFLLGHQVIDVGIKTLDVVSFIE